MKTNHSYSMYYKAEDISKVDNLLDSKIKNDHLIIL